MVRITIDEQTLEEGRWLYGAAGRRALGHRHPDVLLHEASRRSLSRACVWWRSKGSGGCSRPAATVATDGMVVRQIRLVEETLVHARHAVFQATTCSTARYARKASASFRNERWLRPRACPAITCSPQETGPSPVIIMNVNR